MSVLCVAHALDVVLDGVQFRSQPSTAGTPHHNFFIALLEFHFMFALSQPVGSPLVFAVAVAAVSRCAALRLLLCACFLDSGDSTRPTWCGRKTSLSRTCTSGTACGRPCSSTAAACTESPARLGHRSRDDSAGLFSVLAGRG